LRIEYLAAVRRAAAATATMERFLREHREWLARRSRRLPVRGPDAGEHDDAASNDGEAKPTNLRAFHADIPRGKGRRHAAANHSNLNYSTAAPATTIVATPQYTD